MYATLGIFTKLWCQTTLSFKKLKPLTCYLQSHQTPLTKAVTLPLIKTMLVYGWSTVSLPLISKHLFTSPRWKGHRLWGVPWWGWTIYQWSRWSDRRHPNVIQQRLSEHVRWTGRQSHAAHPEWHSGVLLHFSWCVFVVVVSLSLYLFWVIILIQRLCRGTCLSVYVFLMTLWPCDKYRLRFLERHPVWLLVRRDTRSYSWGKCWYQWLGHYVDDGELLFNQQYHPGFDCTPLAI